MKLTLSALAIAILAGCGAADRAIATATGVAKACVEGVQYLQFISGVTVAYTQDGKIKTCKA